MSIHRIAVTALSLSAAAFVTYIAIPEDFVGEATIPTKGDRPTVGFGSTYREDGSPVQLGDTITPPKALARTLAHIQKDEAGIKRCVRVPLYQAEYDMMVDFAYQYGIDRLCSSSIVRLANSGDYEGSCRAYTLYRFAGGYDCSTPGNKRCRGVWERSLKRRAACMGAAAATATADTR